MKRFSCLLCVRVLVAAVEHTLSRQPNAPDERAMYYVTYFEREQLFLSLARVSLCMFSGQVVRCACCGQSVLAFTRETGGSALEGVEQRASIRACDSKTACSCEKMNSRSTQFTSRSLANGSKSTRTQRAESFHERRQEISLSACAAMNHKLRTALTTCAAQKRYCASAETNENETPSVRFIST